MEYNCHTNWRPSISNEKLSISNEKLSISIANLGFWSKSPVFQIKIFEILGFSHVEFEILGIFSEIPSISKKMWNRGL